MSRLIFAVALLTVLPFQLRANEPGSVQIQGRVRLRADIDQPFSAEAQIPAAQVQVAEPPAPPAPSVQYVEPPAVRYEAPQVVYEAPQVQFIPRVRYRLRMRSAFYYQPYTSYEPVYQPQAVQFADPYCPTCPQFGGFSGIGRQRVDIRYRYRSGW